MSSEHSRPQFEKRKAWLLWLPIGLLLYAVFVVLCFYMEDEGRSRFKVLSTADIAAIEDRAPRIRAEGARARALEEMREWRPYAAYSTGMMFLLLGGGALSSIVGARIVWRGVQRDSVRKAKLIVAAVLLILVASLVLLGWPAFVAEKRFESKRTTFVSSG